MLRLPVVVALMIPCLVSEVPATHEDFSNCTAVTAYPGASIYALPCGQGLPFTSALAPGGYSVDATITLTMLNLDGDPIFLYPYDDIWLESVCGGLVRQPRGTCPDHSTDINGQTTWTAPVSAGGYTEGPILVMIAGTALNDTLDLKFNSADINGDLDVTIADCGLFATIDFGDDDYHGDFNFDGVVDLRDMHYLTTALASSPSLPPGQPVDPVYVPCQYRLGIFFTDDYLFWDERRDDATNINYAVFTPFDMHVVAIGCPDAVAGYEAAIVMDPALIITGMTIPGGGLNLGWTIGEHKVCFNAPQIPDGASQAVLLATLTMLPTVPELESVIRILPPSRSSLAGDGPALLVDHGLVRANFTPTSHSGCGTDLPPGVFPDYVATTYGSGISTSVNAAPASSLPRALAITAVAPNPFNAHTTVGFALPSDSVLTLAVLDGRGRLVRTLWSGPRQAGHHRATWDGRDAEGNPVASGIYLVRLKNADGVQQVTKVTLAK